MLMSHSKHISYTLTQLSHLPQCLGAQGSNNENRRPGKAEVRQRNRVSIMHKRFYSQFGIKQQQNSGQHQLMIMKLLKKRRISLPENLSVALSSRDKEQVPVFRPHFLIEQHLCQSPAGEGQIRSGYHPKRLLHSHGIRQTASQMSF